MSDKRLQIVKKLPSAQKSIRRKWRKNNIQYVLTVIRNRKRNKLGRIKRSLYTWEVTLISFHNRWLQGNNSVEANISSLKHCSLKIWKIKSRNYFKISKIIFVKHTLKTEFNKFPLESWFIKVLIVSKNLLLFKVFFNVITQFLTYYFMYLLRILLADTFLNEKSQFYEESTRSIISY